MARSWRQRHRLARGDKVHGIQGRVRGHVSVVHDVVLVAAASPQAPPGAATALTVTATVAAAASSRGSESSPRQAVSPQGAAYPVRLQRRQPGPIVVPKFGDLSTIVVVSVRLGEDEK
uniref:Uncharacterized protein n=1 Tax=Oryza sativa subsp. japonica TaxID=39947 RepID=Q69QI7_ORYSJ|nr:hypothetical protein [Oryza sativa Japonica Group]